MTLADLMVRRALVLERALRTDSPDLWMDVQGLDADIAARKAKRAQLVADCDAHPESDDYCRAEHALQDFDAGVLPETI